MEEGTKGLINGVKSALQRLKKVAQLPDENTLIQMKDVEIEIHNKEIDEAIDIFGDHATRDQNSMLLLREQNALWVVWSGSSRSISATSMRGFFDYLMMDGWVGDLIATVDTSSSVK
jgi:hypothetical protein